MTRISIRPFLENDLDDSQIRIWPSQIVIAFTKNNGDISAEMSLKSTLRFLESHEWEAYRKVRLRALKDCPDAFGSTFEGEVQFSDDDWKARLQRPDVVTVVCEDGCGNHIGLIVGAPYGADAGLFSMWIAPEARRQGIGGRLVDMVISWAEENNERKILLDVGDLNRPAIGLYASKGFEPTGVVSSLPAPREDITEHQRELIL